MTGLIHCLAVILTSGTMQPVAVTVTGQSFVRHVKCLRLVTVM